MTGMHACDQVIDLAVSDPKAERLRAQGEDGDLNSRIVSIYCA